MGYKSPDYPVGNTLKISEQIPTRSMDSKWATTVRTLPYGRIT